MVTTADLPLLLLDDLRRRLSSTATASAPATRLYKGIAERTFERRFQLADHVVVKGASLENGLCTSTSYARFGQRLTL
jgi:hypothetical protein